MTILKFVWFLAAIALLAGCDRPVDKPAGATKQEEPALSPAERLAFAEKCSKNGMVFFVRYRASNMPDGYLWDEPEFHYSAKRNTCLLYARFVSKPPMQPHPTTWHMNAVIDIFANKTILQGNFERTDSAEKTTDFTMSDAPNMTSTAFRLRKEALFSE